MLTLPNFLTLLRIIAVPVFLILLSEGQFGPALLLFLAACITDTADGVIARLTDATNSAGFDADIGFDNSPPIDNHCIGNDSIRTVFAHPLRLAHPIADHFSATEFHFLAVDGEILFDAGKQISVGKPNPIADSGAKHLGIGMARDFHDGSFPMTLA